MKGVVSVKDSTTEKSQENFDEKCVHFCLVCGFETEDKTVAYDHDCMKAPR